MEPLGSPPVSAASAESADRWAECLDRLLGFRPGVVPALRAVLTADPDLAVAHCLAAHLAVVRGESAFDAAAAAEAAARGRADHAWEADLVAVTGLLVRHGLWTAVPRMVRHHDEHPGDLLGLSLVGTVHTWSTEPDRIERMQVAAERSREAVGEHPFVVGMLAMVAQDQGRLDEARALAEGLLDHDPRTPLGAHPLSHVFFESGDHGDGLGWLDAWLADADVGSPLTPHLGWHSMLHLLELDELDEVVRRYVREYDEHGVQPTDSPSMLWRCQLVGAVPAGQDPHDPTTAEGMRPGLAGSPPTFQAAHQALALATAADADGLRRLARRARASLVPGTSELVPDLALGLAAYVEGAHGDAADHLLLLEPHVERLGGSHAQREVFEDTLIRALVHAGRGAEARTRLRARLDRRGSRLDSALLAAT